MKLLSVRMLIGILVLTGSAWAVAGTPAKDADVRDLMSAKQFHQAGLDKLSAAEVQALNDWLGAYLQQPANPPAPPAAKVMPVIAAPPMPTAAVAAPATVAPAVVTPSVAPPVATAQDFGKAMLSPAETGEPESIESSIPGKFTGWTGETTFTLANGQVWKQAGPGFYETHLKDPVVVIKRLGIGYLLTIKGEGGTVFVRRLH
jgi:hypothetical protein